MRERKKPAISFSPTDWAKLRSALEKDPAPESSVLLVMIATGVRIGDVLRIELASLRSAVKNPDEAVLEIIQKGGSRRMLPIAGAPAQWTRLAETCAKGSGATTVAEAICPTSTWGAKGGGGAYQRVNRHLRDVATRLGLQGRPHLHRVRRTVATRALNLTRDIHLVSGLLGHAHVATTETYLDEVRGEEIAELQRKLASR